MTLQRLQICSSLINKKHNQFSLLDLGCRTMELKPLLKGCRSYVGTDFVSGEDVVECNLEKGLPQFPSNSKDVVVALDVLEHVEQCHMLLSEAMRVARCSVYVSFPNMYYIDFRLRYLFKGNLSGKYNFPLDPIMDRHRWVLSYTEAVNFIEHNCSGNVINHYKIIPQRGRTRLLLSGIENFLGHKYPDIFSYGSIHEIRLNN